MSSWDAAQYLQFADERTRPANDLVSRIALRQVRRAVDLGCGPGNSTAIVRQRWPTARIVGLDNSPQMIAAAAAAYPEERWRLADIASWEAEADYDLLFANAALQWLPDHATLFPHLFRQVAPGGALAVQMPARRYARVQELLLEVADDPRWRDQLVAAIARPTAKELPFYYDLLATEAAHLDLWATEYSHRLADPAAVVEWISGSALRPYLAALPEEAERTAFRRRLLAAVDAAYPRQRDGHVLLSFRRLFIIAYR